jgi:peptide/nickel transport system substrate-binding protein
VKDLNNLALQFEQGKLDTVDVPNETLEHIRQLKSPAFKIYNLGPSSATTFLMFNLNNRLNPTTQKPFVDPVKSAWFRTDAFRQAVDYAISREAMVQNVLKGTGQALFSPISPASPYFDPRLFTGHPQNLEKAKALLRQAGFKTDPKGQLRDNHGHAVEFTLLTNAGNSTREASGLIIKEDLSHLGIKVNFKPIEFNVMAGKLDPEQQDWEALLMGLTGGNPYEPNSGANVWKSGSALHLFNQRMNKQLKSLDAPDALPWEKDIDRLFDEGARVFDLNERKTIYNQFQQIVYQNCPLIHLFAPLSFVAVKDRIRNLDPTPLGGATHNLEELWIKQ